MTAQMVVCVSGGIIKVTICCICVDVKLYRPKKILDDETYLDLDDLGATNNEIRSDVNGLLRVVGSLRFELELLNWLLKSVGSHRFALVL